MIRNRYFRWTNPKQILPKHIHTSLLLTVSPIQLLSRKTPLWCRSSPGTPGRTAKASVGSLRFLSAFEGRPPRTAWKGKTRNVEEQMPVYIRRYHQISIINLVNLENAPKWQWFRHKTNLCHVITSPVLWFEQMEWTRFCCLRLLSGQNSCGYGQEKFGFDPIKKSTFSAILFQASAGPENWDGRIGGCPFVWGDLQVFRPSTPSTQYKYNTWNYLQRNLPLM